MNYKKEAGIYILTNTVNGKQYVGETLDIKERIRTHKKAKTTQVIHCAIRKHGWDKFHVYVEYLPDFDKKTLIDLEEQLIKKFNSFSNGYNCSQRGSVTGRVITDEFRQQVSRQHKGKKLSDEHKKIMSDTHKGKKQTKEQVAKRAATHRIKISQFSKNGIWIADFDSMTTASSTLGISLTDIASVCRGDMKSGYPHKSAGGFIWRYTNI